MQVLENNLKFNGGLRTRPTTKRIVLHHSASGLNTTIQDLHRWHLAKNWAGIGYHYVIYPDGRIYRGRPEKARGSHAYQDDKHEANTDGLGICMIGNFQDNKPTESQMSSLVRLIYDIWTRYPRLPVIGHKDVMPTACPGAMFPWTKLKERLEAGPMPEKWKLEIIQEAKREGLITTDHDPDEPASKWFVLVVGLHVLKALRKGK